MSQFRKKLNFCSVNISFFKMLMVLCTLFIHINIIPFRQKIHLI